MPRPRKMTKKQRANNVKRVEEIAGLHELIAQAVRDELTRKNIAANATEDFDKYATNWHLYDEADRLVKAAESFVAKLNRNDVKSVGKKVVEHLWALRRCCDQHAG